MVMLPPPFLPDETDVDSDIREPDPTHIVSCWIVMPMPLLSCRRRTRSRGFFERIERATSDFEWIMV